MRSLRHKICKLLRSQVQTAISASKDQNITTNSPAANFQRQLLLLLVEPGYQFQRKIHQPSSTSLLNLAVSYYVITTPILFRHIARRNLENVVIPDKISHRMALGVERCNTLLPKHVGISSLFDYFGGRMLQELSATRTDAEPIQKPV